MKLRKLNNGYYSLYDSDGDIVASNNPNTPCSKRLSKQNCDEIFGVTDVNELANQNAKKDLFNGGYDGLINAHQQMLIEVSYINGFNKAMELNKDKLFTVDDIKKAMDKIVISTYVNKGSDVFDLFIEKNRRKYIDEYIQSLQQPTEIEVEIVTHIDLAATPTDSRHPDAYLGTDTGIPFLDENGCLILKKK